MNFDFKKHFLVIIAVVFIITGIISHFCFVSWAGNYYQIRNLAINSTTPTANASNTLIHLEGIPVISEKLSAPMSPEEVLYYTYEQQRLIRPGDNTSPWVKNQPYQATELQWVTYEQNSQWAPFQINGVTIKPYQAKLYLNVTTYAEKNFPKTREWTKGMPEDTKLQVIGRLDNSTISDGTPFIISNLEPAELLKTLKNEEPLSTQFLYFARFGLILLGIIFLGIFFYKKY